MRDHLYIAVKAPRAGFAKTRLGTAIGDRQAAALYEAFLFDLAARFRHAPFGLTWYATPSDASAELSGATGANGWAVLTQPDGDWTERQRFLFRLAATRGEERVVLIASDSPHVEVAAVVEAFACLDRRDVVVGPVRDGGYFLIGMRGWRDVLAGITMSTANVLDEIEANARRLGVSVSYVEETFDVDEAADLAELAAVVRARSDLPATQAALHELGLLLPTVGVAAR